MFLRRKVHGATAPCATLFRDIHAGKDACICRDWIARLAPRERDLMFIGAGVAGHWRDAQEAAWFYEGYGPQQPDAQAMAYYRCERIVADVVDYCEQIMGEDRARTGHSPWPSCDVSWRPAPNCRSPAAQLPRCLPQAAR